MMNKIFKTNSGKLKLPYINPNVKYVTKSKPVISIQEDTGKDLYKQCSKKCIICKHNIQLNYKNIRLLSQFVSPYTGKFLKRDITGLCIYMEKHISGLIQQARRFGLMSVIVHDVKYLNNPKLFNYNKKSIYNYIKIN
ncbi:28S ribosomal protein S18-1, mitochondrial [Intoshia linei]|uniref:28S ribosomal protein S18-1, mitochondrial n=1 Tax=Intoshia linei TaxID=1819745 RepID=A0A177BDS9_9BILA|nr:28S ribosomal protein S18-1, mitochondrial [Intoshia linei]